MQVKISKSMVAAEKCETNEVNFDEVQVDISWADTPVCYLYGCGLQPE